MKIKNNKVRDFLELGKSFNHWDHGYDFPRCNKSIFQDIVLKNKNVLEIGCGAGLFSLWASFNGAKNVVGLEPLEQGSGSFKKSKIYSEFTKFRDALNLKNITMLSKKIQDYCENDMKFDIVLSNASVNHLNETSCIRLHDTKIARDSYLKIFNHIGQMMNSGGKLIILDCSKKNFFGDIGFTNPFVNSIEWFKHQTPELWIQLLKQCGFVEPKLSWPTGRFLRYSNIYSRNRLFSYFIDSTFRLELTYKN